MVEAFVGKGAEVTVLDVDAAALQALTEKMPAVRGIACDVSNPESVASAAAAFHESHRAADVVVNNAGILHSAPLLRISASGVERHALDAWNKVIAVNLTSVFLVASAFAERMVTTRTKGVIVNISSISAAGNAGQSAYSAAKAGVNALTATWAKELAPMGIRVVADARGALGDGAEGDGRSRAPAPPWAGGGNRASGRRGGRGRLLPRQGLGGGRRARRLSGACRGTSTISPSPSRRSFAVTATGSRSGSGSTRPSRMGT
jgi:3-oxoacyl-[acyl-carrier protein] reductase